MPPPPLCLPDKGLQALILRQVVHELPRYIHDPLWPLAPDDAATVLSAALALFCTGDAPALSPAAVFSALRRSPLPTLDLTAPPALAALGPHAVADILAAHLIAHSGRAAPDVVALRVGQLVHPRARSLLAELLRGRRGGDRGGEPAPPLCFTLRGDAVLLGGTGLAAVADALGEGPLEALELHGVTGVDDGLLGVMLAESKGSLDTLDLAMSRVTSEGLAALFVREDLRLRDGLRSLDLSGTSIDGSGVLALTGMSKLRYLSLAWTPVVRPTGRYARDTVDIAEADLLLGSVLASLPALRRLDLSGATIDLGGPVLSGVDGVRELILASSRIDDVAGRVIFAERLPAALQVLDLSDVSGTASVIRMLQAIGESVGGTVEDINLANCKLRGWDLHEEDAGEGPDDDEFDTAFDGVGELNLVELFNSSLHELRALDLSYTGGITERTLVLLFVGESFLHRVVKLSMRGLQLPRFALRLRQWANAGVVYSLPALETLDLSETKLADSAPALTWFITALLTDAADFHTLSLASTHPLTYEVVAAALTLTARTLRILDVQFCPPLMSTVDDSDSFLARLCHIPLPKLRSIDIRGCGRLPLAIATLLMQHAPALQDVIADKGAFPEASEPIGFKAHTQAYGRALALAADRESQDDLDRLPWRARPR